MEQFQEKMGGGASALNVACVACVEFSVKMEKLRSLQGQVAQEDGAVPGEDGGGGASDLNVARVACADSSVKMEKRSPRQG
ncbi:hypothetical protein PR003_g13068, partial [Phytophthora rubi]